MKAIAKVVAVGVFLGAAGCGPVMEATRPAGVNMQQFTVGESRMSVVSAIGAPTATIKNCDIYKLYTGAPSGATKGAIAAGEAVGDVLTLGLTEVIWSPIEAGTRNVQHTVTFCYQDDRVISINDTTPTE